VKAIAVIS